MVCQELYCCRGMPFSLSVRRMSSFRIDPCLLCSKIIIINVAFFLMIIRSDHEEILQTHSRYLCFAHIVCGIVAQHVTEDVTMMFAKTPVLAMPLKNLNVGH